MQGFAECCCQKKKRKKEWDTVIYFVGSATYSEDLYQKFLKTAIQNRYGTPF